MSIQTITHVEFHCADADKTAAGLSADHGFTADSPVTAPDGARTVAVRQGTIRLHLTSAADPEHPVAEYVARHGDGVAVLALGCADPAAALERAERHGARVLDRAGALIEGFGDTALRLVHLPDAEPTPEPRLLDDLDHVAICLPAGALAHAVRFCEAALGFRTVFEEYIEVGEQAMDSAVVQSASGAVTFTLIEPDSTRRPGQIDEFLAAHGGAGVQHLAFGTRDIARAVRTAREHGVEFLTTPGAYFDALAERLGGAAVPVATLRELHVLVDQDHGGRLFQIFARSTHPRRTFFLELIERRGAGTFGTANIKALYEAVERHSPTGDDRSGAVDRPTATDRPAPAHPKEARPMTAPREFRLTEAERALLPTPEEVAHYREHGWYLSRRLFSDEELDSLQAATEQYYAGHRDHELPVRPPRLASWRPEDGPVQRHNDYVHHESDAIGAILRKPLIGAVAALLAGTEEIRIFQSTLIYKPPVPEEPSNRVPWHFDKHYWQTCTSDEMLTAFIPFHDCREENGTITMVDGSHRWRELPSGEDSTRHFADRDGAELEEILAANAAHNGQRVHKVPIRIPRGHVSFHHCRTYHGSGPNLASHPRRAISLHLQDGANEYRRHDRPDGEPVVYNHDVLVRRTDDGRPDYADPRFCPAIWRGRP
ncbi:4-hydroxyphenylpyruvate dioxygenase [Kitasatospora sp. NPDC048298]|uniref:4-hydroxyphenylpyruvate dioxygenase n=1 Tax=Kitasatospora sp. NPDC048298 TaxID=3364049 RepID=UPI00371320E2